MPEFALSVFCCLPCVSVSGSMVCMNSPLQENEEATLAELEARARELENELAGIQSAIAILLARMNNGQPPAVGKEVPLAPSWDTPLAVSTPPQSQQAAEEADHSGIIHLQSLQPHHALRSKWGLGSGLEDAEGGITELPTYAEETPVATELRLFGLLPDGAAWEQRIPFAFIVAEDGAILGRDENVANVVLADASISRAHVRFALNEQGLTVSDMGSTNGTAVNDVPLTPYDNYRTIQSGDTLTLGCINLQIEFI